MKKWFSKLLSLAMALVIVLALVPQRAEAASGSFEGEDELWAGDRVTVTFYVKGSNLYGVDATLNYDGSALEWLSVSQEIGGSWNLEHNGSSILLWDSKMSDPINDWTAVFSATFRVRDGVSPGTEVSASVSGTASDGSSDTALSSASWSAEIRAPLSGNADLDGLWCSNADLTFDGSDEYYVTVPYEVSELDLDWSTDHDGAWADVSGNSLSVGSNTVTITVTAENGNTNRYYIYATREQDPNYVPSSDATLSGLSVSVGQLSPAFRPDVLDYVVYLPNEISEISLSGTAQDAKAVGVEQVGSSTLLEGNNLLGVKCTAEDKTTAQEYKVTVIRMPVYAGELPQIIPPVTEPVVPEPEPIPTLEIPTVLELPYVGEMPLQQVAVAAGVALVLIILLLCLLFWALGRRSGRRKAQRMQAAPITLPDAAQAAPAVEVTTVEDADAIADAEETPTAEEAVSEDSPAEEVPVEVKESPDEEAACEEAAEEEPAAEEPAAEQPSVEQEAAEELPVAESAAEEVPTEDTPSQEDEEVGRMSLTELLDDIRNM